MSFKSSKACICLLNFAGKLYGTFSTKTDDLLSHNLRSSNEGTSTRAKVPTSQLEGWVFDPRRLRELP